MSYVKKLRLTRNVFLGLKTRTSSFWYTLKKGCANACSAVTRAAGSNTNSLDIWAANNYSKLNESLINILFMLKCCCISSCYRLVLPGLSQCQTCHPTPESWTDSVPPLSSSASASVCDARRVESPPVRWKGSLRTPSCPTHALKQVSTLRSVKLYNYEDMNITDLRKDLQINFFAIAWVRFVHWTFQYFWGQIARCPTKFYL